MVNFQESALGKSALQAYLAFLRKSSVPCFEGDSHLLALPFKLVSGHATTIVLKRKLDGSIELSDECASMSDLFLATASLPVSVVPKAKQIADFYGLGFERNVLSVNCKLAELGEALHRIVQARMRIGDLLLLERMPAEREERLTRKLRTNYVERILRPDVVKSARRWIEGETEVHHVDFYFNTTVNTAIKALDRRRELMTFAEAWAFKWQDIRKRQPDVRRVMVYDHENSQSPCCRIS